MTDVASLSKPLRVRHPPAINLLRTRLQASGSPGHPQRYTGFVDVARQTLAREGWPGLYKGLVPNLAKVVPAVSISYVVSLGRRIARVASRIGGRKRGSARRFAIYRPTSAALRCSAILVTEQVWPTLVDRLDLCALHFESSWVGDGLRLPRE